MVLDKHRKEVDPLVIPVAKIFKNWNPNTISWIGLIIALISGVCFVFSGPGLTIGGSAVWSADWLLLVGAGLVILSGFFDTLDGKVAKLFNKCTKKGDYLDHVFDRYADLFMIGGIAISTWCNPVLGLLAISGVLLTSYMGTQAQAVGGIRLYSGLLGRADRVILTTIFPIIQFIFLYAFNGDVSTIRFDLFGVHIAMTWLEVMMLYFAIVGHFTAVQRAVIIWKNMPDE